MKAKYIYSFYCSPSIKVTKLRYNVTNLNDFKGTVNSHNIAWHIYGRVYLKRLTDLEASND